MAALAGNQCQYAVWDRQLPSGDRFEVIDSAGGDSLVVVIEVLDRAAQSR